MTSDNDHIVSKIDGRFYDVEGEFIYCDGKIRMELSPLDKKLHDFWEASGESRTEIMIQKQKNAFRGW